jgi:glycosyltransferase involved in cell wall biosynthesis
MPGVELRVLHLHDLPENQYDVEYQSIISWGKNLRDGYCSIRHDSINALVEEMLAWMPRVVLIYGYAWRRAVPVILRMRKHGISIVHRGTMIPIVDPRQGWKAHLRRPLRKLLLRLFDTHHYGGDYSRQVLQMAGIRPEAMFFVPYSVDSLYFLAASKEDGKLHQAAQLRKRLGWAEDDPVILYIGQHNWFKGPDIAMAVLAKAQAKIRCLRALIVGHGGMTQSMIDTAGRALVPGSYHFTGFVPSYATVPYYLASDLVLFTSRYETWGRAMNEAMLCERPCLTNRMVGAAGGLVEDGMTGLVVNKNDVGDYVARIENFFALPRTRRWNIGESARERALEFSYERHESDLRSSLAHAAFKKRHQETS